MSAPPAQITHYQDWLERERGLSFATYEELWQWSVDDLEGFWRSVWDWFGLQSPTAIERVLSARTMPGAHWFEGAQVNYTQRVLRHVEQAHAAGHPAIVFASERHPQLQELSWPELGHQVAALAQALIRLGVVPGDRVAAYLPNAPETVIAFLACASIGAIWSVCSPEMGPLAVLDRFRQIAPKVLIAVDGQLHGGTSHDRRGVLREVLAGLPSVQHLLLSTQDDLRAAADLGAAKTLNLHELLAGDPRDDAGWQPSWLPFEHPIWIVYSSGTTGLPKPIVHGHGGVMLEGLASGVLHNDLGPSRETGDRLFWLSSTGWIVWNGLVAALLGGTTICLYDGSPTGTGKTPDWGFLWRFVAASRSTFIGAGAAFYASCLKADVHPQREGDLSRLRAVGSTGSPLSEEAYQWIWDRLPRQPDGQPIWLAPISGGTDIAGPFVGGLRTLPVVRGEMQVRCLGCAVQAYSDPDPDGHGRALFDEVGELVCTEPMPSMPLCFWNDEDGRRYFDSYFDLFAHPRGGRIWRHGDWIRLVPRGQPPTHHGAVIYGRSDATINRHGIRMGTAELYRAVEALPEVIDSLVVDLEYLGRESWMPLFVVLRDGLQLDDALQDRMRRAIREALSARHVPSAIFQVAAVPRTLSGKKMELPVKKLLLGAPADKVFHRDAMTNADSIEWFVELARKRNA